jgi:uncharacterized protein (DUF433 family)
LNRISIDRHVMGGKACVRGTRVTVGTVIGLIASGHDIAKVLELYPYLTEEDIRQCLGSMRHPNAPEADAGSFVELLPSEFDCLKETS